jgi:hypothetical protein
MLVKILLSFGLFLTTLKYYLVSGYINFLKHLDNG